MRGRPGEVLDYVADIESLHDELCLMCISLIGCPHYGPSLYGLSQRTKSAETALVSGDD